MRTTLALLGLFSLVTLLAHQLLLEQPFPVRQAAWYTKAFPTFADALAFVREQLWSVTFSFMLPAKPGAVEIPCALFERPGGTLAFAV